MAAPTPKRIAAYLAALNPNQWAAGLAAAIAQPRNDGRRVSGGLFYFVIDGQPVWVVGGVSVGAYQTGSNDGIVPDLSKATAITLPKPAQSIPTPSFVQQRN